ncbi:hypothetical protein [Paenibacillus sp. M2]|uniref:hypothetical protein n=1 Tax=Paenibacillus sp. M2 TaxID=3341793 RepID=UPI003989043D
MNESSVNRRNQTIPSKPPKEFRAEYNAVKNYMHNELGITKDDILQIIKETVQTEISKVNKIAYIERTIEDVVKQELYGSFRSDYWSRDAFKQRVSKVLTDNLADIVASQLSISVEVNKEG